jgi:DNA-directed RNA polymerase specialized sigma24 family protein
MRKSRYSDDLIIRMIGEYQTTIRGTRPGRQLENLLRMADLDKALDRLPMDLWRVVLVHGLLGVPRDKAAEVLKISTRQVTKLYTLGIEEVSYWMNGGE